MSQRIAIFPGSFDPVTKGHVDIVLRALPMFDKIIVAIGDNTAKKRCFTLEKRLQWLKETFKDYNKVEVDAYFSLTTDYCKKVGAKFIIRGLRSTTDYHYEANIARINHELSPEVDTVFLLTSPKDVSISSSLVREILFFGGNVDAFVPKQVNITPQDIQK